jgi:hypothetical protein
VLADMAKLIVKPQPPPAKFVSLEGILERIPMVHHR